MFNDDRGSQVLEENSSNTDANSRVTFNGEPLLNVTERLGHFQLANHDIMEEAYDSQQPTTGESSFDTDTGNPEVRNHANVPAETDKVNYIFVL